MSLHPWYWYYFNFNYLLILVSKVMLHLITQKTKKRESCMLHSSFNNVRPRNNFYLKSLFAGLVMSLVLAWITVSANWKWRHHLPIFNLKYSKSMYIHSVVLWYPFVSFVCLYKACMREMINITFEFCMLQYFWIVLHYFNISY